MPFGAAVQADGTVRFRLWAPAADRVELDLPERGGARPMRPLEQGWHELALTAAPGEPYSFLLPDGRRVADPASRCQAGDALGPSLIVDPAAYRWRQEGWPGRPWHEAVVYELHVGTFTPQGTFRAAIERLPHLAELGVTALEIMPVADFVGRRNWGYDGVLPFAPDRSYGAPDDLKALIDAAHGHGLMVLLDVVHNHFGPEGNDLARYAPGFFTDDFRTPWGAAIDFREPTVRAFFVHNALYWLEEYRFDGLRFDAVHAIVDPSETHILVEMAREVRRRIPREVHLVLENEDNEASHLGWPLYDAQWNDDVHHVFHTLLTGEAIGYYRDYADHAPERLARGLAEGFVYQGEPSRHRRGERRGRPSAHLPSTAFIDFLQNHDQIGNRAEGERLTTLAGPAAVQACQAVLLLSPHVPMLFMGEEWGATTPFAYFCDFQGELGEAIRAGRRREFAAFHDHDLEVPDPLAEATFRLSQLRWSDLDEPRHQVWLQRTRELLALRARAVAPRLALGEVEVERAAVLGGRRISLSWRFTDGSLLSLLANLGAEAGEPARPLPGEVIHATHHHDHGAAAPWSATWFLAAS